MSDIVQDLRRWTDRDGETTPLGKAAADEIEKLRVALFMCAAHCQGGSSNAGVVAANELGIPFPIRMDDLVDRARKEGLDPDRLWPWLRPMRAARGDTV